MKREPDVKVIIISFKVYWSPTSVDTFTTCHLKQANGVKCQNMQAWIFQSQRSTYVFRPRGNTWFQRIGNTQNSVSEPVLPRSSLNGQGKCEEEREGMGGCQCGAKSREEGCFRTDVTPKASWTPSCGLGKVTGPQSCDIHCPLRSLQLSVALGGEAWRNQVVQAAGSS